MWGSCCVKLDGEMAQPSATSRRRASFAAVLADPDHDVIVAEVANEGVGLAHLMVYEDLSHGAIISMRNLSRV